MGFMSMVAMPLFFLISILFSETNQVAKRESSRSNKDVQGYMLGWRLHFADFDLVAPLSA